VVTFFLGSFIEGQNNNNEKVIQKFIYFLYISGYYLVGNFFKDKIGIMKKP
jgi:hypothetical protein